GIFIFTDNTAEYISVEVTESESHRDSRVISSLSTMRRLKCAPDAEYADTPLGGSPLSGTMPDSLADTARRTYQQHVVHFTTAADSSKKSKEALAVISSLIARNDVSRDSKRLLKQIERLVRSKDNFVIRQVMKYADYQASLFGADDDINALLETTFAHFADRAQNKRGEARLAIFSETKSTL
ncbi:MAG: hypothetical protein K2H35_00965, partial [Muribaculaceae bacterium]|nr:hypothetical protein [Muribaculaceae bacterium]